MTTEPTAVEITTDPIQESPFQNIDSRQIIVSRIASLIFSGIVSIGILIGILVFWFNLGVGWQWGLIAAAGALLILFLLITSLVWPNWEYQATHWRLTNLGLEIHRGVFWKHRISVPFARVQHADVSQGPLQRQFDLGKLTVHTAGTQNASVELEGISHEQAIRLRDEIVSQRKAADVV
ncbi:MAG: PH domain-containing protein [Planctomycetota bacterium]